MRGIDNPNPAACGGSIKDGLIAYYLLLYRFYANPVSLVVTRDDHPLSVYVGLLERPATKVTRYSRSGGYHL